LHRVANARKAYSGQYQGLLDPIIIDQKDRQERDLQGAMLTPTFPLAPPQFGPWQTIEAAEKN
jgi:hypothetical protein